MKFKMSEKSLFATLLRSPWWVSFLVLLAVALVAGAVLPDAYKTAGMLGAFPFFVIGVMAAWRQRNAVSPAHIEAWTEKAGQMAWPEFSKCLEQDFLGQGFQVSRWPAGPADFLLEKNGQRRLVSAKRWKAATVGVEAVSDLIAAQTVHEADLCCIVSLGRISPAAMALGQSHGLQWMGPAEIAHALLRSQAKR